jgi:hypothetical protein
MGTWVQVVRTIMRWLYANHWAEPEGECATYPATHDSGLPPLAYQQWPNVGPRSQELSRRLRLLSRKQA